MIPIEDDVLRPARYDPDQGVMVRDVVRPPKYDILTQSMIMREAKASVALDGETQSFPVIGPTVFVLETKVGFVDRDGFDNGGETMVSGVFRTREAAEHERNRREDYFARSNFNHSRRWKFTISEMSVRD